MYLFLDLTGESVIIQVVRGDKWVKEVFPYDNEDALLNGITVTLKKQKIKIPEISGLAVRIGKGRFTATRVAVTVANTFSYALGVPAISYREEDLNEVLERLKTAKPGVYVHPEYSGPASVGKK